MDLRQLHRFIARVHVNEATECWEWVGHTSGSTGYAQMTVDGHVVGVHRLSYEHFVEAIPDGFQIDHLCRVRHCVNPLHLEAVTVRENVLRGIGVTAMQARQTHCVRGHEFTPDNLIKPWPSASPNSRICKKCRQKHDRERRARRRAEKQQRQEVRS